jgi:ketosteroid isomerase-like protein
LVLDNATVERVVRHWSDGWNSGDLDTIMAPFAPGVRFSSPGIAMLTGDASKLTIEGREALRAYIVDALRLAAGIEYTLRETHVGTDSVVIVYGCGRPGGRTEKVGADLMRVDETGQVVEWRCHY